MKILILISIIALAAQSQAANTANKGIIHKYIFFQSYRECSKTFLVNQFLCNSADSVPQGRWTLYRCAGSILQNTGNGQRMQICKLRNFAKKNAFA